MTLVIGILVLLLCAADSALAVGINATTPSRGMLLCTGARMVEDAKAVIYQTREVWNSTLAISVAHCGELGGDLLGMFAGMNVSALDICGGTLLASPKRLRGWFCKAAALVLSPYVETMVVDLDTVWFKSPEVVFSSPAYQRTGSLFFRDKTSFSGKRLKAEDRIFQDIIEEFVVAASKGRLNVTTSVGLERKSADGHSFFWRNVANRSEAALNNFQDSSCIVLDRSRHPNMLRVLTELIPSFNVGYGDKEIYWLAATIADEPFSFEPFLCSLYGDCGLLMHYDPNDVDDPDNAQPLYLNGEWILEKIHVLGHDLEFEHPKPVLVNDSMPLINSDATRGCQCRVYGCRPMPEYMNVLLLRAQWERLQRFAHRSGPEFDCMPIYKPTVPLITQVAESVVARGECPHFGCVDVPIYINESASWFSDSFCDPLYFTPSPPEGLKSIEKRAQLPPPPTLVEEGELVRPGSSRTVYIVRNGTLHAFPDLHTFISMGKDFGDVKVLPDYQMHYLVVGAELPKQ